MMLLLSLPTEIIDHIIYDCLTNGVDGGFENLMLTCKTILQIGKGLIPTYNRLCQWRDVDIGNKDKHEVAGSSLEILSAIAREPMTANFIELLNLRKEEDELFSSEDEVFFNRAANIVAKTAEFDAMGNVGFISVDEATQTVAPLVRRSEYLRVADQTVEHWRDRLQWDEDSEVNQDIPHYPLRFLYRAVFLLTMLPSLKHVVLPKFWSQIQTKGQCHFENLLPVIQTNVHAARAGRASAPVSQSETICVCEYGNANHRDFMEPDFCTVVPFMALPRLSELRLMHVEDRYFRNAGSPCRRSGSDIPSTIRTLTLEACTLNHDSIHQLLQSTPQLSSFSYSHIPRSSTGCLGSPSGWDTDAFVGAIASNCAETLTTLSITDVSRICGEALPVRSFAAFHRLERLELDRHVYGMTPSLSATTLPTSIREIKIWMSCDPISCCAVAGARLFDEAAVLRNRKIFPHLQHLDVSYAVESRF